MPAAAEGVRRLRGIKLVLAPLRIEQLERALNEEGAIGAHANRHVCHDKPTLRWHVDWKGCSLADSASSRQARSVSYVCQLCQLNLADMDVAGLGDNLRVGHVGQGGQVISLATSALERSILLAKRAVRPFPSQMIADGQQAWFESVAKERSAKPQAAEESPWLRTNISTCTLT